MNKIICGNAQEELKKIEDNSVDLIVTSPPYFDQRDYTDDPREIGKETSIFFYIQQLKIIFHECYRVCKSTGNIVFNIGDKYINGNLMLIPYKFAIAVQEAFDVKLVNDITWVKSNPTPRQYKRRLTSATEPFFHFAKTDNYYYNRDAFLDGEEPVKQKPSLKKGMGYDSKIKNSDLTAKEKVNAFLALFEVVQDVHEGKITDFRMKIRGVHKKAFGGQSGGRNSQIDKQGFTVIKMYGKKLKRDVIVNPVANTKNIDHPAVFPLQVIKEMIESLSKENDVVLDPFCGSGQVCLASKSLNRRYLGIDINSKYCQISQERLEKENII